METYNDKVYAHCILLNETTTKILLVKEYKPLINKYIVQVPTMLINYNTYDKDIKSWFNKYLSMNVILNNPDELNMFVYPDITTTQSTIVHVFNNVYPFENKDNNNKSILESMWIDFKDIKSLFKDPNIYIDEFTFLILSHYSECDALWDKINELYKRLA